MPRWMHFISQAKEIRRSDYLNREYQFLTTLPWPLADREAIVKLLVRQDAGEQRRDRARDQRTDTCCRPTPTTSASRK
jgi:hypothetical protein